MQMPNRETIEAAIAEFIRGENAARELFEWLHAMITKQIELEQEIARLKAEAKPR